MKENFILNKNYNPNDVQYFCNMGYPLPFARVLSQKGFNQDNFAQNMRYDLNDFFDPMLMHGMSDAVNIISSAMRSNKSILIYGDYDADGLSASAVLSTFFTHNGITNEVLIPTRDMGYGMHTDYIASLLQQKHYDVLVTVDCGISNVQEVAELKQKFGTSLDIIVTDHHEVPDTLPDCICVNPKLGYPFAMLSGSGVAFKLVQALSDINTALNYADIAIIGTIADIMPLTSENRTLVRAGLLNFNHKSLKKIAELSKSSTSITTQDIAMKIAPKINASGRVGDPRVALEVLLANDRANTQSIEKLLQYNEERKTLTESITNLAIKQCLEQPTIAQRLAFVVGQDWRHGVLGIVAGRLKEYYNLPAVVMAREGDNFVGSARGVDGINLHQLFVNASQYLVRFGGHKSSVGFTVSQDNVENLKTCLISQLQSMPEYLFDKNITYDIVLGEDNLTLSDIKSFADTLEPSMPNNELRVFVKDFVKHAHTFGKGDSHLAITMNSGLQVKAFFNYSHYLPVLKSGAELEMIVTLTTDSYSGDIQAILNNIAVCNSLHFEPLYVTNYLLNLTNDSCSGITDNLCDKNCLVETVHNDVLSLSQANEMIAQSSSVLCVFDDYQTFDIVSQKVSNLLQCRLDFFATDNYVGKVAVISPQSNYDYKMFETILIFGDKDNPIRRTYSQGKQYFVNIELESNILSQLTLNRDMCVLIYKALKAKQSFDTLEVAYNKYLLGKIDYNQYIAGIVVMSQIGLFDMEKETLIDGKVNLQDSKLFCYLDKNKK